MKGLDGYFDSEENLERLDEATPEEIDNIVDGLGRLPKGHRFRTQFKNRVATKKRVVSKPARRVVPTNNLTAKAEFENRMGSLPDELKKDIKAKRLQIVDSIIYGICYIGNRNQVEILQNADVKTVGKTNINARKLEKDRPFLVTGVIVTSGVGATGDGSITDIGNTTFTRMPAPMLNGEFSLEVGGKVLIPAVPMEMFNTKNRTDVQEGFVKMDNPKWIEPQTEIVPEVKLPVAAADKTYIKVQFVGATLEKR